MLLKQYETSADAKLKIKSFWNKELIMCRSPRSTFKNLAFAETHRDETPFKINEYIVALEL